MPESVLEQLDKSPKDQQVDVKEIQDALKEGFFDKEENRDALQNEFNGKPDRAISQLAKSFDNSLHTAISNLTNKIKANQKLIPQEIKILKLNALIEKKIAYKDTDFGNTDWAKDLNIRGLVTSINPYYQQTPLGQTIKIEKFVSKDIQGDIQALNQSLGDTYEMMTDFLSNIQATMTSPGSTDYRLQNSIISDVSRFLEDTPLKPCTSYAEYQQYIKNISDFFNACIHSNGLLDDKKNPAFDYFAKNASVQTGSQTVGPTACIKFGNMLTAMSSIKTLKDKEKIKGSYYELTREILGGSMYGLYKEGSLGSFGQGQNMEKLQGDIISSEEMQKYPDLKIVANFLQKMGTDVMKDGQDQMNLETKFEEMISNLNGKVPTATVAYLRTQFNEKKEDIQKEINMMTSGESLTNILTISGMQVLNDALSKWKIQLSEEEIALAGEYFLKHGEFQPSIMTLFQMKNDEEGDGGDVKQFIHKLIQERTTNNIIKQRNMVIYNRLSRFALTSALSSDPVRADAIYKKNALFKVYNDVEGIGEEGGWSDARIQGLKAIADEIVVTILVTAFSGGVASLAVRGVFGAIRAATIGGRIALFAAKMIVEGIVFHATTVGVNALISQDRETMLEELKSPEAWARSILYLGVMRGVSKVLQMPLALGSKSLQNIATPVQLARFAKGVAMPMEIGGMMVTDQVLSLTFDQQFQEVTIESFIQTVTLVVGLKAAHKIIPSIPPQGDITSDGVEITGITKKEGVVTDISYRQKVLNSIDAKVDYLADLLKIKSGVRSNVATNILNSIDIAFIKEPGKDYSKPLQAVKNTIEQLRQEGRLPKKLEEKYNEVIKKIQARESISNLNNESDGYHNMPADYQSSAVDLTNQLGGKIQIHQEYVHPKGWDYIKLEKSEFTENQAKKLFEEYKKLNPSLMALEPSSYDKALAGISYKFNTDDIAFATGEYIKNWKKGGDKNWLDGYNKRFEEFKKKYNLKCSGLMLSPKTMERIEEFFESNKSDNGDVDMINKTQPTINPTTVEANKDRSKYNSQEIQRLYDEGKKGESLLIKDLKQKMKEGAITPAEYTRQVKEFQSTFPAYGDVQVAKNTEIIAKYSYPISQETIDRYIANIGENIQGGGGNAEGVHIIKGTNLVAVIKGEGSYVYELPQKTLMSGLTTTRVPRVVDVFVHEGKTYKIMEKSPGIQIDKLSAQQLSEIPQEHYNNFVKDVKEIENAGLSVDPSKPSNFFYDAETGFHLIDLAVRGDNKRSMFDQVGNFNAKGILDNGKIDVAIKQIENTQIEKTQMTIDPNSDLKKSFITEKGENLLDNIKSPEVKKEMLTVMQANIDKGLLDIQNGKAYVEVNGQKVESELFKEVETNFGKEQALDTRLQVRTQNFKNRFGDWQGDPANASKVVDKNGEPLMVWHGTSREFGEFKKGVHRNFESIKNTKDWHYFSTNTEFTYEEYAQKKNNDFNKMLWGFLDIPGESSVNAFEESRNNFVESIGTDKVSFDLEKGIAHYDGHEIVLSDEIDGNYLKNVFSGKTPIKDDFSMGDFTIKIPNEDGTRIIEPLRIYIPNKDFIPLNLPFFIKSNNISEMVREKEISDLDRDFNILIDKADINTDVIIVSNTSSGHKYLGVKNPNQIKSATGNDGFFNDVSPKFNGEKKSNIDPKIVEANASIVDPVERIAAAKKLPGLEDITEIQEKAIIEAHKLPGEIYNLSLAEIRAKLEVLKKADFTSEQIRSLMENGICGQRAGYKETNKGITEMYGESETIENCEDCEILIGSKRLRILKVSGNPYRESRFTTPYVILDRDLYESSGGKRGFKGLRIDEEVTLGRNFQAERFDFGSMVSREHVKISYKNGNIIIEDLFSTNGTKILSVNVPEGMYYEEDNGALNNDMSDKELSETLEKIDGRIKDLKSQIESEENELPNYKVAAEKDNASQKIKEIYQKRKTDLEIKHNELSTLQEERMKLGESVSISQ